ncbi:S1 RNA-binding domain-containing protein [Tundrisphaera lichenicola]|uniref:S1 RNA-binding domain-containing protein n=1 Tax=Tundrisphaera lichenicola TaxID=2029860 RepID=UPI003EBA081F
MDDQAGRAWEEAKQRFPTGMLVTGVVVEHRPFGIFVDLADPVALGLVQIVDFVDRGGMTPELYPPIGSTVEAVVLGHTEIRRRQVWLGMKPSQLKGLIEADRHDFGDTAEV